MAFSGTKISRRPLDRVARSRESHRIYVTSKTPFRSVTARVRKRLDRHLREASYSAQAFTNKLGRRKNASLETRMRALEKHANTKRRGGGDGDNDDANDAIALENAGEVLVLGTGRAIERVLHVASFFQNQGDCIIKLHTSSVAAEDDVIAKGDNGEEEDGLGSEEIRKRHLSCLEVSIRLR
jgi:ribonuclease P/MRP protein subunit POP7